MAGRMEIPLRFKDNGEKNDFWIGDWGDAPCMVDLSKVKFLLFESRNNEDDYTLIIDNKRPRRNFNREENGE